MISGIFASWQTLPLLIGLLASSLSPQASPSAAAIRSHDCFEHPSRCGYPDATSTGVPPGTRLKSSGSLRVTEDGETLSGLDVRGKIVIAADNVTVDASRITQPVGGEGSYAVLLEEGADGFTIEDSEVAGPRGTRNGLESAVWNHYDNPGAAATRVYFHRCADCWEGAGAFRDSYMVVDAAYPGSHDENVYACGTTVKVLHSTLINRHRQTATVFGDTSGCGPNHLTVADSLLAGGGYVLYPQANSDGARGKMTIADNRFARCRTTPVYDAGSGGEDCVGGPDSHGLFPNGGYFGLAAHYYLGPGQVWKGNVWDDNGRAVCPDGACRRGGAG